MTIKCVLQSKSLCFQDGEWIRKGPKPKWVDKNGGFQAR